MINNITKIIILILLFYFIVTFLKLNKNKISEHFTPMMGNSETPESKKSNNLLYKVINFYNDDVFKSSNQSLLGSKIFNYIDFKVTNENPNILSVLQFGHDENLSLILKLINNFNFISIYKINIIKKSSINILKDLDIRLNNFHFRKDNHKNGNLICCVEDMFILYTSQLTKLNYKNQLKQLKSQIQWQLNIDKRKKLQEQIQLLENKLLVKNNEIDKNSPFRFVCALSNIFNTFIIKSIHGIRNFSQLTNTNFIYGYIYYDDYIRLKYYLSILGIDKPKIKNYDNLEKLFTDFKKSILDIIFISCSHPNTNIKKLSFEDDIIILDFDKSLYKEISYFFNDCSIYQKYSINDYNILTPSGYIYSYTQRFIIVSKNQYDKWNIFLFLKLITDNSNYLSRMSKQNFGLYENRMSRIHKFLEYHEGAKLFWENQGHIVTREKTESNLDTNWIFWQEFNLLDNKSKTIFDLNNLQILGKNTSPDNLNTCKTYNNLPTAYQNSY